MKSLSVEKIVIAFRLLMEASLNGMDVQSKFTIIRIVKVFKKVADEFDNFRDISDEKLRDERYDEMLARFSDWEDKGDDNCGLSEDERREIKEYFRNHRRLVDKCVKPERERVIEVDVPEVPEKLFEELVRANGHWRIGQIMFLEDVLMK